jgi:hypothetical protein
MEKKRGESLCSLEYSRQNVLGILDSSFVSGFAQGYIFPKSLSEALRDKFFH